jgi:phage pi2 protein 07
MKAILNYNGFTKMVEVAEPRPVIYVPIIPKLLTAIEQGSVYLPEPTVKKWVFEIKRQLTEDIYEYDFLKEE